MKNIGSTELDKGVDGELKLVIWDAVPECSEICPIFEMCNYKQLKNKCSMRKKYIKKVVDQLSKVVDKTDDNWHKVGFMLVPLYSMLISFKISALAVQDPIVRGKMGLKAHPSYKEIRETIKTINQLLSDLNVSKKDRKQFLNGDSDYYENMINNGEMPK